MTRAAQISAANLFSGNRCFEHRSAGGTSSKQSWSKQRSVTHRHERGYVLLTLLLFVSILIIGAAVIAPSLAFQIRRDREEELVHRGVQYTRAVRSYAKRTGRYPVRTEELLGGPEGRYIRKLYKDPMTGGEFKLLHLGDVQPGPPPLNSSNTQAAATDDASSADTTPASSDQPPQDSADSINPTAPRPNALGRNNTSLGSAISSATSSNAGSGGQPRLLIFGVVSKSKARTIREFDHKNHYNDWLFYYDPSVDRGYEIKGPTSRTPLAFPTHSPNQTPGQSQPTGFGQQQQPQGGQQPQETPVSQ